ncbi:LamG-like jellyroll fold domain-containing protein [Luteolibacter sp. Populi]|uniref:LamG domain-containing protein n=1 Tax=Luteolibacter sp. Populi TaxID=3230487 RepID=UPI003465ABDE
MKQPRHLLLPLGILLATDDCRAELLAHYKFDEAAAATLAVDDLAGTSGAIGTSVITGVAGKAGSAYQFPDLATQAGIVDMGNASFFPAIVTSQKLSFSAWVKTADTTGNRNTVVFAGDNTAATVYADLGVAAGQTGFLGAASARSRPTGAAGVQSTGIFSTPTVAPVNDDAWHHLVMTVDLSAARLELWVDGVLANSQTLATASFPVFNNFEIGRLGRSAPVDPYSGLVDDVQVYNHVLTSAQIIYLRDNPGQAYTSADSEPDGLADDWEIQYFGDTTSQSGSDIGPDADGATNLQEQAAGTNPTIADTDGDGRNDGPELNTPPLTDPLDPDSDNDGLSDGAEVNTHLTDPNNPDSDSDTLPDAWEVANLLNPNSVTGDDGETGDPDGDDLDNTGEYNAGVSSSNPRNPDTDGDGYNDLQEDRFGSWGGIGETGTNPVNPDTDGDGIPDGQENPDVDYAAGVTSGTDPNMADTDGDGFSDKAEFIRGTDPTDNLVFPTIAKGLVAHYKFDEAAAATVAANALGNSPGAVGSAVITGATGIAGNAYQFGNLFGQADIVDMGNADFLTDISTSKALTFTAWIKSTDVSSGRNAVISATNSTLANSYVDMGIAGTAPHVGALSGRLRPNGETNISEIFSNTAPDTALVNNDAWHHVAMTIDLATTSIRLYVDGVPTGANNAIALAVFPAFNNFEIGRLGRLVPTDGYQGLIDDVQVYNEALAPARVAALFAIPGVSADEDHDRLDDQWEIDNFGSIAAQNGLGDPDGDGINNEAEETAGTAPVVLAKITSVNFVAGGNYTINFTGVPNTAYRITRSTTLAGFTDMVPPLTATTDGGGSGVATVPAGQAADTRGFYRVENP